MAQPVQEFVQVLRALWKLMRWALFGMIALMALILLGEVITYFRLFSDVHPILGWVFLAAVVGLTWWLVGVPIWRFLRMPVAVKPPPLPSRENGLTREHLVNHLNYVKRYLQAQLRNPLMERHCEAVNSAIGKCEMLQATMGMRDGEELDLSLKELEEFENRIVDPLLKPLDDEADRVLRQESLSVGVATAIALNGTLDALIVLWRNVNMISRIAKIYYGRPGPRGSFLILRDVSTAVVVANYLDNLTDYAGGLLGKWVGGVASVVAGPLLNGGVNAVVTMRVGYLAKARCRSFEAWTEEKRRHVITRCIVAAKDGSVWVLTELVKQVGGVAAGVAGGVASGAAGAGGSILRGAMETMKSAKDLFTGQWGRPPKPDEEGPAPAS